MHAWMLLAFAAGHGMDPEALARVPSRMQKFVDDGETAGLVVLIRRNGAVAVHEAKGWRDREARATMAKDTIFQIASMTKPVTGAAVMMLADEGLIGLGEPVEKHLPEFRGIRLANGSPPARLITIRDLLTHTSGLGGSAPGLAELFQKRDRTLAEAVLVYSQQRLAFEPGSRWGYSNMGIAALGRIVEVTSGMPYERFLATRLFEPLGMKDTFFYPPEEKHARIAAMYQRGADGKLNRADFDLYRRGARYPAPEGGLYSTAADLSAFYQMMLDGGVYQGRRLLSKAAVETMTANHTGTLKAGFAPGFGYGLSWGVIRDNDGIFRMNSLGTYGHGGAWRTYGWIDPARKMTGVILQQRMSSDGDMAAEFNAIMSMAAASVRE